jgi:NTP pyrophosphatase (non-canonical NTP hydrolase)
MSTPPKSLSFSTLRDANRARVPQFRNSQGGAAHSKADGSDWSPSQWMQALVGELGELARVRVQYEAGQLSYEDYVIEARKEIADVQCYLDLLSSRVLDKVEPHAGTDASTNLMRLVADLGEYANWRKKLERGDIDAQRFAAVGLPKLAAVEVELATLPTANSPLPVVSDAHTEGVDLGAATRDKFNEVSRRVGAQVFITTGDQVERG